MEKRTHDAANDADRLARERPALSFDARARASRADQTTVRRANLGVVLRHIAANGSCSRAEVAAGTGLTRGTVSSLVSELVALDFVRETGRRPRRAVSGVRASRSRCRT